MKVRQAVQTLKGVHTDGMVQMPNFLVYFPFLGERAYKITMVCVWFDIVAHHRVQRNKRPTSAMVI
jgi:hypothetical protein